MDTARQRRSPFFLSRRYLVAFAAAACFASAPRANATEITFDGLPAGPIGTTYVEKGYEFYDPSGLYSYGVGGTYSFDTSPGSTTLVQGGSTPFVYEPTRLTRADGGAFDFISGDFADWQNTNNNFQYQFVFDFADGSSISQVIMLDEEVGSQTLTFNYSNLSAVYWGNYVGTDPYELQWDNIRVNATPIPAALPLFVFAIGGLGFVASHRKQHGAA
jgi:hypothetical protein